MDRANKLETNISILMMPKYSIERVDELQSNIIILMMTKNSRDTDRKTSMEYLPTELEAAMLPRMGGTPWTGAISFFPSICHKRTQ